MEHLPLLSPWRLLLMTRVFLVFHPTLPVTPTKLVSNVPPTRFWLMQLHHKLVLKLCSFAAVLLVDICQLPFTYSTETQNKTLLVTSRGFQTYSVWLASLWVSNTGVVETQTKLVQMTEPHKVVKTKLSSSKSRYIYQWLSTIQLHDNPCQIWTKDKCTVLKNFEGK